MKTLFGYLVLLMVSVFFAACDGGGNSAGLAETIPGVSTGGSDFVMVGPVPSVTSLPLPPTGTCEIPEAAKSFISLPSPMKYQVTTSNVLWCTQGIPVAGYGNNIDFSKSPISDLTCLDLVSDVPEVKTDLAGVMNVSEWACCSFTRPEIGLVNGKSVDTGYVETAGIACFPSKGTNALTVNLQVKALCSISGTFMGWSCDGVPSGAMSVLPVKK
jgi:hypothetical protein